jgi:creatinine amidohydrolase
MADQLLSHCLADLAYPDIQAYLKRDDIILIPMASLEQHGPHLPLSTDTVTAYEVSRRAAEQADVLYTPTVWTGYSPQHMRGPGQGMGTITIRAETLNNLLYDIARSLIHHGFTKLIFVNGHGSNVKVIDPVLRKIRYDTGAMVAFYKPYAERYMGLIKDLMENPPEETPGWHSLRLRRTSRAGCPSRSARPTARPTCSSKATNTSNSRWTMTSSPRPA